MLINKSKNYDADDVITFRLVTGEEVISRYVSETDSAYTISRPMVLMAGPQGSHVEPDGHDPGTKQQC